MDETANFLTGTEVCKGLDASEVEEIAKICKPAEFKSGEVIIAEDTRERELYVIRTGRVSITLTPPQSGYDEGTISQCVPGQVFGELGFIDGARRSTFVVALENVEAVQLNWDDFSQLLQDNMKIGYQFLYNLALVIAERLRDMTMFCSNLLGIRGR